MKKPKHHIYKTKYRPVLTAEQISYLIDLAKADYIAKHSIDKTGQVAFSIISSLSPFKAKIDAVAIQPSYTPAKPDVDSVLESLGETTNTPPPEIPSTFASKESYWEYCYNKWQNRPADCTMAELIASDEHRYLNSLMSPSEVKRHEQLAGGGH